MKLIASPGRLVIKRDEVKEKITEGGLIIPKSVQEKPVLGTVVSSGSVAYPPDTRILFNKYGGVEVEVDTEPLIIILEEDVLAVIEGE